MTIIVLTTTIIVLTLLPNHQILRAHNLQDTRESNTNIGLNILPSSPDSSRPQPPRHEGEQPEGLRHPHSVPQNVLPLQTFESVLDHSHHPPQGERREERERRREERIAYDVLCERRERHEKRRAYDVLCVACCDAWVVLQSSTASFTASYSPYIQPYTASSPASFTASFTARPNTTSFPRQPPIGSFSSPSANSPSPFIGLY